MSDEQETVQNQEPLSKVSKPTGLEDKYWRHLLIEGARPVSVFAFCDAIDIPEGDFYKHHASFEALEASYWKSQITETIAVLHQDEDYPDYPTDQKLLAFFYTFFAHVQKNRSRLTSYFPKTGLCSIKTLQPMRHAFTDFSKGLVQEALANGTIADRKKLTDYYDRALFEHLRVLIEFYRNDTSENFQDTDAFIEKSTRLALDSAQSGALDSAIDLARFMLRKLPINK